MVGAMLAHAHAHAIRTAAAAVIGAALGLLAVWPAVAGAQTTAAAGIAASKPPLAQPGSPTPQKSPAPPRSPAERAALIEQLRVGHLPAGVDARALFQIPLQAGDPRQLLTLLELVDQPDALRRARRGPASFSDLPPDVAALTLAQASFLTLPSARRAALLARGSDGAAAKTPVAAGDDPALAALAALKRETAGLQALLAGTPAPRGALELDLLDADGPALSPTRRKAILKAARTALTARRDQAQTAAVAARRQVDAAQQAADGLWGQLLGLTPADYSRLAARAAENETAPAQAAAAARAQAARAAQSADSELKRLVETERGRLLAAKERQARFEARVQAMGGSTEQVTETTLAWRRKVGELRARSRLQPGRAADADALYLGLVGVLQKVRGDLRAALKSGGVAGLDNLRPPTLDDAVTEGSGKSNDLLSLRSQLEANAQRLADLARRSGADERAALYASMATLNAQRLALIDDLSPDLRRRILGFGPEGLAQVQREADQIGLSLLYNIRDLPRVLGLAAEPFRRPTPNVLFDVTELVALLLGFAWWRRRGAVVLRRAEDHFADHKTPTLWSASMATMVRIVRRVGRPLEWFALTVTAWFLRPAWLQVAGFEILWITVLWLVSALVLTRMVDVLAHGEGDPDPRAQLRGRSLRLLAGVSLLVGLALTLTSASVGRGAIFHWVLAAAWLPLAPVAFILADWWKERISVLAEASAARGPVLRWAASQPAGVAGGFARVAAGGALLFEGARSRLMFWARDIALVREIFDQRTRARAALRAAADQASGRFRPLADDRFDTLAPHRAAANPGAELAQTPALEMPDLRPGSVQAIIGARGLGKSTALSWWRGSLAPGEAIELAVGPGGLPDLLADLALALGVAPSALDGDGAILSGPLGGGGLRAVFIDDLQRLVAPAIGGLADFDRLIELTRRAGKGLAWVFACDVQAWNYLFRARHDRAPFDSHVTAPRWGNDRIRALVERRTAQAGLDPAFEQLEQLGRLRFDSDLSPDERNRAAYFDDLCDYCRGNPAVALEFWRRSLFEDVETGKIMVRTFSTPDPAVLETLPGPALYVLRAIIQMDVAGADAIQNCTDLPAVIVKDALRSLARAGVIAAEGAEFATTLFWLRDATRALERRNLLSATSA